jgi:hypothetical protein
MDRGKLILNTNSKPKLTQAGLLGPDDVSDLPLFSGVAPRVEVPAPLQATPAEIPPVDFDAVRDSLRRKRALKARAKNSKPI